MSDNPDLNAVQAHSEPLDREQSHSAPLDKPAAPPAESKAASKERKKGK